MKLLRPWFLGLAAALFVIVSAGCHESSGAQPASVDLTHSAAPGPPSAIEPAPAEKSPAIAPASTAAAAPVATAAAPDAGPLATSEPALSERETAPPLFDEQGRALAQTEQRPTLTSASFQSRIAAIARAIVSGDVEPALPAFFHEPRRRLLPLSTLAYVDQQASDGQAWLLSADLLWLKKEQVTLYPEIAFHGVELGPELHLPLAFFRRAGSRKFRRLGPGKFERGEASFALHEVVALSDQVEVQRGERYFQTARGDDWLREQDAVLPVPRSQTPWGARVGQEDHTGRGPKDPRQTWLEVSVLGGWLLAFEGTKPVFATLISGGRGGIPQEGKNTLEIAATPVGTFPISGKLATVTLEAPGEYVHSDVPWTQNFQKPYAIHTAYWHDNWGNLASGGCINVSPIDGKWLFDFTEPKLPRGWHAVRWRPATGAPTLLVVHE